MHGKLQRTTCNNKLIVMFCRFSLRDVNSKGTAQVERLCRAPVPEFASVIVLMNHAYTLKLHTDGLDNQLLVQ